MYHFTRRTQLSIMKCWTSAGAVFAFLASDLRKIRALLGLLMHPDKFATIPEPTSGIRQMAKFRPDKTNLRVNRVPEE